MWLGIQWCHPLYGYLQPPSAHLSSRGTYCWSRKRPPKPDIPHSLCRPKKSQALSILSSTVSATCCYFLPSLSIHQGTHTLAVPGISDVLVCPVAIITATLPSGLPQVCSGLCFGHLCPMEALPGWWNVHPYLQSGQYLRENAFFSPRRKKSVRFFWCELRSYILHRSWRHAIKDCQICMHAGFNWRLSRRCYNISHLTWQPYILLTAFVHNFLALNKLKVPLCNLTPELRRVRMRVGARRFLLLKQKWLTITGQQNPTQAVCNTTPNTDRASRAQVPVLSETRLSRMNWAEATSCPALSLANFLVGQMDFQQCCSVSPAHCPAEISRFFALQHEGTRALEELKKTLGNQQALFSFFLFLSSSSKTLQWCFPMTVWENITAWKL